MAGVALTSKTTCPNTAPWAQKALGAAQTAGKVWGAVQCVREAIPVVQGFSRAGMTAASYAAPFVIYY